ncbi:MAG: DUF4446 family protein [Acidobacteriaceae bacterium]
MENLTIIIAAAAGIELIGLVFLFVKLSRLDRIRKEFLTSGLGKDLEQVLIEQNRNITQLRSDVLQLNEMLTDLTIINQSNYQKMGFVRFNPFEDAGANMSFALALLNGQGDGVVISSLHGREGTRMYAKTVEKGNSKFKLTEEELTAIKNAKQTTNDAN